MARRTKKEITKITVIFVIVLSLGGLIFSQTQINKEIKYMGINYRDPFADFFPEEKKVAEKIVLPDLKLTGLVWGTLKPRAIINGTVVGKGDWIQGVEIIDIQKQGLILRYKGEEFFMDRISGVIKAVSEVGKE